MKKVRFSKEWYFKKLIEDTITGLKRNNIAGVFTKNKEDAINEIMKRIPERGTVTHGGSLTIEELGVANKLLEGNYNFLRRNRPAESDLGEIRRKAFYADVYLTSVNAITKDGMLIAIDGFGNRTAAIMFGPKKVIVVAGKNKIVETLDDAFKRIEHYAAPLHAKRRGWNLPCTETGKCVDCKTERRICNKVSIVKYEREKNRITVILVAENLGL
jgi:L-lactate utilization protein LutB